MVFLFTYLENVTSFYTLKAFKYCLPCPYKVKNLELTGLRVLFIRKFVYDSSNMKITKTKRK